MKLFNPPIGAGRVCLHVDGARAELSLFTSISFLACVEERERKGKDFYMFVFLKSRTIWFVFRPYGTSFPSGSTVDHLLSIGFDATRTEDRVNARLPSV
jgi:hypothetical protein